MERADEVSLSTNDEREAGAVLNCYDGDGQGFDSSKKGFVIIGATNRPRGAGPSAAAAWTLPTGRFRWRRRTMSGARRPRGSRKEDSVVRTMWTWQPSRSASSGAVRGGSCQYYQARLPLLAVRTGIAAPSSSGIWGGSALEVVIAGRDQERSGPVSKEKQSVNRLLPVKLAMRFLHMFFPMRDPVHKITIIPRTKGALGYTMQLPGEDKYLITREELEDRIAVAFGGRAAEEVLLGQVSTGAANDIEQATELARRMVTIYGMTERFDMVGLELPVRRLFGWQAGAKMQRCHRTAD
ncbi:MAG: hypothetical protein ACLR23_00240 [Clostridia bacterium]